jgi:hypothetical protein
MPKLTSYYKGDMLFETPTCYLPRRTRSLDVSLPSVFFALCEVAAVDRQTG